MPQRLLRADLPRPAGRDALRRRLLATADALTALLAAGAAGLVAPDGAATLIWSAALMPLWLLFAKVRGLYDADHVRVLHRTVDELGGMFNWCLTSVAATALVLAVAPGNALSLEVALAMFSTAFVMAALLRTLARLAWRKVVPPERALVLGDGPLADAVTRKLWLESGHHLSLVARADVADPDTPPEARRGILLSSEDVARLADDVRAERVIVALHDLDEGTLSEIVASCRQHGLKLSVAPPLQAMLGTAVSLNHLAELPLIEFKGWNASRTTMLAKRCFDVAGAATLLVLAWPLFLAIMVAVRLESRGPAFFRQARAGRYGQPFTMLKFRTMVQDAEQRLAEVVNIDALDEPMYKLKDDPRVTRVGRFLRRTSLDELPQLLNVLRGDMSLVGPRPEEIRLAERYTERERFRLEMRPGMTGPMQVHGRGELKFRERMAVEREYVENYSLEKDLRYLMRTLAVVWRGRGAY